MTIYDLLHVMDSMMSRNIIIHNDADIFRCGPDDDGKVFEGEVSAFRMSDLYDEIQGAEVTELHTLPDGRLVIYYYK